MQLVGGQPYGAMGTPPSGVGGRMGKTVKAMKRRGIRQEGLK